MIPPTNSYQTFISHAGTDKHTIAIPLYERLLHCGISSFVDEKELRAGDQAPKKMITSMETAPVGIFILSPEFLAKKWTMKELQCFHRRTDEAERREASPPILIPVFYRMTVEQCSQRSIFKYIDEQGQNVFVRWGFYDRMETGETSMSEVLKAVKRLSENTGVRNDQMATNANSVDMAEKRTLLIDTIVQAVENALRDHSLSKSEASENRKFQGQSSCPEDTYQACFLLPPQSSHIVMDFSLDRDKKPQTVEGRFKQALMETRNQTAHNETNISANQSTSPSATGMGGVGKSSALIALGYEHDIRKWFDEGVFLITLGERADVLHILQGISTVVESCGGEQLSKKIMNAGSVKQAVDLSTKWFEKKRVLFLLDDIWPTEDNSIGYFEELRRLVSDVGRIAITTRNKDIAHAAGHPVHFGARDPQGVESRNILFKYAHIQDNTEEIKTVEIGIRTVLDQCAGLPLALGITGKALWHLTSEGSMSLNNALEFYVSKLGKANADLVLESLGSYPNLQTSVLTSLNMADDLGKSVNMVRRFRRQISVRDMYMRLSVVRKQAEVPASMLGKLWNMSQTQVMIVTFEILSKFNLITMFGMTIGLHDLLLDFCTNMAIQRGEIKEFHADLLRAYHCPFAKESMYRSRKRKRIEALSTSQNSEEHLSEEVDPVSVKWGGKRAWWDDNIDRDGYLRHNLTRHLVESGNSSELQDLLIDPRWTIYRVRGKNFLAWESDFAQLFSAEDQNLEQGSPGLEVGFRAEMKLIRDAVSQAWSYLRDNMGELQFQMFGRLICFSQKQKIVAHYLRYMGRVKDERWLMPLWRCFESPRSPLRLEMTMESCVETVAICADLRLTEKDFARYAFIGVNVTVVMVDLQRGQIVRELHGHSQIVSSLALSAESLTVLSGSWDKSLRLWDAEKGDAKGMISVKAGVIKSVAISRNGRLFAAGFDDGTVRVWNALTMKEKGAPLIGHTDQVTCVAMSADGRFVVSGSLDEVIRIWDTQKMEQAGNVLIGHTDWINSIAISSDGNRIVSGGDDQVVRVWDLDFVNPVGKALEGHEESVASVDVSADGRWAVSVGDDLSIRVWDLNNNLSRTISKCHSAQIRCASITDDGKWIVTGAINGELKMWNVEMMVEEKAERLRGHEGEVRCATFSLDGRLAATGSVDGSLRVWDTDHLKSQETLLEGHSDYIGYVSFSTDGRWLVSGGNDGTVRLWNMERMEQEGESMVGNGQIVTFVGFCGDRIVSASSDNRVRIWDMKTQKQKGKDLKGHSKCVRCVAMTRDEKWFVTGSDDCTVRIWNARTNEQVGQVVQAHKDCVIDLKIRLYDVVSESWDKVVHWRIDDQQGLVKVREKEIYRKYHKDKWAYESADINDLKIRCNDKQIRINDQTGSERVLGTVNESIFCHQVHDQRKLVVTGHTSGMVVFYKVVEGGRFP